MKGSDKWGQGGGPRIRVEVILAALVVVTLVGVYLYVESNGLNSGAQVGGVTTISTTGVQCDDNSMPQAAQAVEQAPTFTNLSDGLCYNYLGESQATMTFAYYNGTIAYPCGDAPMQSPASEILVNVTASQSVVSAHVLNSSRMAYEHEPCGSSTPPGRGLGRGRRVDYPGRPAVERDAQASPQEGTRSRAFKAVLTLDGGSQIFRFGGVTAGSPLRSPGSTSSMEIVLSTPLVQRRRGVPDGDLGYVPGRAGLQLSGARRDRPDSLTDLQRMMLAKGFRDAFARLRQACQACRSPGTPTRGCRASSGGTRASQ